MRTFLWMLILGLSAFQVHAQDEKKDALPVTTTNATAKFGALIQIWNTTNFGNKDLGTETFNTFRIRRIELKFSGKIDDRIGFTVMIDPSKPLANSQTKADSTKANGSQNVDATKGTKSETAILQDLYITYLLNKEMSVEAKVGQFKYPLTYEGLLSSSGLSFIDRAEVTKAFGDKRDVGIQLSAKPGMFEGSVMIVQGNSQNKTDVNKNKDIAARLIAKPMEGLSVGGSLYKGFAGNDGKTPQDRYAIEGAYKAGKITSYGEFIFAKDAKSGAAKSQKGAYIAALYRLTDAFEPGLRYEWAGKNFESNKGIEQNRITAGLNYYLEKNAKIQLNYVYGKYSAKSKDTASNLFMINWQVNF